MWNKIKMLLWKINLLETNKCPICGEKLFQTGYADDFLKDETYICSNRKCMFNKNKGYCCECGLLLDKEMLLFEDNFCSIKCYNKYHNIVLE